MSTSIPIKEEEEMTFKGRRQGQPKRSSLKKDSGDVSGSASVGKGKAVDRGPGGSGTGSQRAKFGKEEVFSYPKPSEKYKKDMHGVRRDWAKPRRALHRATGTVSSNASSAGGQIGYNKKLIYTEINAGRLYPSTGLQEFLDSNDPENFRLSGPDGPVFLDMPEEELWAQLEQWSNEDYRRNEEFVRAGSNVRERLFSPYSLIFDVALRDGFLYMRPEEFEALAAGMEENYQTIRNSALYRRNPSILTSARQAGLLQLSGEDLVSALERWNANYTALSNRGFFMGPEVQYYSHDDITELLDQSPEELRNWSNQFYGEDEPILPAPQGAGVSVQSEPVRNENRSSNEAFIRAGSNGQDLRNRLFGPFSMIFSEAEQNGFLNLPPAEFQALVRRVEENYPVVTRSPLAYRRFLTPERQARLVQLPGEELASTLQRWLENYDELSTELSFFQPGGGHGYYTPDQITEIIDMSPEALEEWIEQWLGPQGARLK